MQCPCFVLSHGPFHISLTAPYSKNVSEHKMCYDFLYKISLNFSHFNNNWARYDKKFILVFVQSTLYSCEILINFEIFQLIFQQYSNMKFIKILRKRSRVFPCGEDRRTGRQADRRTGGQADRRTGGNDQPRRPFRNFADKTKNEL
jgi:hypothetical protein